jgi:hypothetical protein
MLNFAVTSTLIAGASAVALTKGASVLLTPANHSEAGSLVFFGFGLLVVSLVVRRSKLTRVDR